MPTPQGPNKNRPLTSMVVGEHPGVRNTNGELATSVRAPEASLRVNVATAGLPFTCVVAKRKGCCVCAETRRLPTREKNARTTQQTTIPRRVSPEGRAIIPNFLALNAGSADFREKRETHSESSRARSGCQQIVYK